MKNHETTITGSSIKLCRAQAAKELGVEPENLRAEVLQYGKQGLFSDRPYRIRFTIPCDSDAPSPSSSAASKIDLYLALIQSNIEHLSALSEEEDSLTFESLLDQYEDLDEELQAEVKELATFMNGVGGEEARRVIDTVSRDGQFAINVSEDNMRASLDVVPPEGDGNPITLSDVMHQLQARGIRQGVDHIRIQKLLDQCVSEKQSIDQQVIATGIHPKHGEDGTLQLTFSPRNKEILIDDQDRADYRGKAHFAQVKEGDELVKIYPPTLGTPGIDVFGEAIPPIGGRPICIEPGTNTRWSEDYSTIYSEIHGVAEYKDSCVYVKPLVLVEGDVDMKTGNIEFDGEVEVMGSVRDHFSVRAKSNITIHGRVEGAEVVSKEGSVIILQGIAGRGRCYISAGTSVEAKYIESATIYAVEDVVVGRAILNSKVLAGGSVLAERGKGMIAGGSTYATKGITAKVVGNVNEPPTRIVLGISLEDYRRIERIDQQIAGLQHTLGKIDMLLEQITNLSRDLKALPLKKRQEFVLLKKQTIISRARMQRLLTEKERLEGLAGKEGVGTLTVHNTLHGKVDVEMGGGIYHNENERTRVILSFDPEKKEITTREHK